MGQISDAIKEALSLPTAEERLRALLLLDASPAGRWHRAGGPLAGLHGAPALRARQDRLRQRRVALVGERVALTKPVPQCRPWQLAYTPSPSALSAREAYRRWHSRQRSIVRERYLEAERREALERQAAELTTRYLPVVRSRRGETEIEGNYGTETLHAVSWADGLVLLRCEGWRRYGSRHPARRAQLAYLCGLDDSGPWAVRVAGSITSVSEALAWITPAAVQRARDAGRTVVRQGDMYVVRARRCDDQRGEPLSGRHEWSTDGRWLLHPEHRPLQVPWPARVYPQRAYQMGRTNRRGAAD